MLRAALRHWVHCAFLLALAGSAMPGVADAQGSTMVFLARHAEKAATPANDPPLTEAGAVRAAQLADLLQYARIGAIISTPYVRTRSTAAPLATRLGLTIEEVPIGSGVPAHAAAVAAAVRQHAGKAVLVVGHSNTITAIAGALGGPRLPDLCDGDYDQLLVVEIPPTGTPRFVRTHFGARAADSACAAMSGNAR